MRSGRRGRATSVNITLTPDERQTLQAWQRSTTLSAGQARRGRILLCLAEGMSISQIAHTVGISRRFVYKWVQRFQARGIDGLYDLPHPGPWGTRRRATAPGSRPGQALDAADVPPLDLRLEDIWEDAPCTTARP